jgi:hypothetical protein
MTPSPVEGLPIGVDYVRIGTPTENEYYITNEPDGKGGHEMRIVQGPSAAAFASPTPHLTLPPNAAVIVKPTVGWKFRASIKTFSFWPVKEINPPVRIAKAVTFEVDNAYDQDSVNLALDNLKKIPGFVEMS